jgi:FKBP-type peptidyl-prolyl cis-trans isomerase FklB
MMKDWNYILLAVILFPLVGIVSSCSEGSDEAGEYDNWQVRNDAKIQEWFNNSALTKYQSYAIDGTSSKPADYIYVEVLESGDADNPTPFFSDTCRVAYRGHLIPTDSYPEGYVFDQSYTGDFNWQTAYVKTEAISEVVAGFSTALTKMRVGDRWRVHIPYMLGYGKSDYTPTGSSTTILGCSNLTFEIALFDFWHPGDSRPVFKAR